jgi:protein-L-isoaspartate(D-aspartate) O-methyltransferase
MYKKTLIPCLAVALCLSVLFSINTLAEAADGYQKQRRKMVAYQIRDRGVVDANVLRAMTTVPNVLRAMTSVPRHRFVPEGQRSRAYRDHPLPIGHGQTISQPFIVAKMSELLELEPGQKVLEVGTGSGYQAAVLADMGVQVFTIEIVSPLAKQAQKVLSDLGYAGIRLKVGDGYKGWPEHAPFDGIIVTCAPSHIPDPLKVQLAEGGRMVIPVGSVWGRQRLVLLRKVGGRIKEESIFDVRFVPMVNEKGKHY